MAYYAEQDRLRALLPEGFVSLRPVLRINAEVRDGVQGYFKPYTCCRWAHQPITACIDLAKEYGYAPTDVKHVYVHTFDSAAQLSKIVPHTADEAQYNIAWPVACSIVHGDVGLPQVLESGLDDPAVLAMMERLTFDVDPEMEAQFPAKRLAWVEIHLADGRVLKSRVYAAPGEHTDHVDLPWMEKKFRLRTAPVLGKEKQDDLLHLLENGLGETINDIVAAINR